MADKDISFGDSASIADAERELYRRLGSGRWRTSVDDAAPRGPVSANTAGMSASSFMRSGKGRSMVLTTDSGESFALRRAAASAKKIEAPDSGAETTTAKKRSTAKRKTNSRRKA